MTQPTSTTPQNTVPCFCPVCGGEAQLHPDPRQRPPLGAYGVCTGCGQIVRYVGGPWFEAVSDFELTRVPQDQFEKLVGARRQIQENAARQQRAH